MSVADEIDGFAVYTDITEREKREQELQGYETIVEKGVVIVPLNRDENTKFYTCTFVHMGQSSPCQMMT